MTKFVLPTAVLAALGLLAVSSIAYAATQAVDEPDLLGGPAGPPVARKVPPKPQPAPQAKPVPPLAAPSARAPLQPSADAPWRRPAPDLASVGIRDAAPLADEEEPAPPIVEAYANHSLPDEHSVTDAVPSDETSRDFARDEAPRYDAADDNGADRSIEDSGEFARLDRAIDRAARSGRLRNGMAVTLYAELDDIHNQREYYQRTRGTLGPQEIAAVLRRLDALDARLTQADRAPVPRSRYRY